MSILGSIGAGVGIASSAVDAIGNNPWTSEARQKRLMRYQHQLNEQAADANQSRSKELYGFQFNKSAAYNSASAARARAEAAGISKATLSGATGATPVASSSGAGMDPGVSIASPGSTAGFAGLSQQSLSLLQMEDIRSQISLRKAEADRLGSASVLDQVRVTTEQALATLHRATAGNQDAQRILASLEQQFQIATQDTRVEMTTAQLDQILSDIDRMDSITGLNQEQYADSHNWRRAREYQNAYMSSVAGEGQMLAAQLGLLFAQRSELLSRIGVNKQQADLIYELVQGQQTQNQISDKTKHIDVFLREFEALLTPYQLQMVKLAMKKAGYDYSKAPFMDGMKAGSQFVGSVVDVVSLGQQMIHNRNVEDILGRRKSSDNTLKSGRWAGFGFE